MTPFFFGVRISTWLALAAFAVVAVRRRDMAPLLAAWTWMWGFEAAYDAGVLAFRHPPASARPQPIFYLVLGLCTVAWMTWRLRVRPAAGPLIVAAAIWVAWAAVGFPVNVHDASTIHPLAEVLNESAKTAWALAYLLPLLAAARLRGRAAPPAVSSG